jgi:transcriptional regulator with XRE-family HTH domain
MLSKIERGTLFPTLPTLLRIALVFGVGLEHFFIESKDRPTVAVIRKQDRLQLPDRPDETPPSYLFESLDFPVTDRKMEAFFAEFPMQSKPSEAHRHSGAELIYVTLSSPLFVQDAPTRTRPKKRGPDQWAPVILWAILVRDG